MDLMKIPGCREAVEETVALDHYLEKLDGKIRPAVRLKSSITKPAPERSSARLTKRKLWSYPLI